MNIAIVGCGLAGKKRLEALGNEHRLVIAADCALERAQSLAARREGVQATADWNAAVEHPEVEAVLVATPHDALARVGCAAIRAGKHVLLEKPAARSLRELAPLVAASGIASRCVQIGFNHRFHPAIQRARQIVDSGALGPLMFVRGRYGHGGRVGYEKEWRADPSISGGGELLDQGVHLIDLARWFLGEFIHVEGFAHTFFWKMPVEDNGFLLLRTAENRVAWLHVSCTEWKNLFSLEIYGRDGKLHVEGLGGSYGTERLTHYRMKPEMGPPETNTWEFPGADVSWRAEFESFVRAIRSGTQPDVTLQDAAAALEIVERIYKKGRKSGKARKRETC